MIEGSCGIFLHNNDTTPMADVMHLLAFAFGRDHAVAFEHVLRVHKNGSAMVAIVPEARLPQVIARLEGFLAQMDKPVRYRVVADPPHDETLWIDFGQLLDIDAFRRRTETKDRRARFWIVAIAAALGLAALELLLRTKW